LASIRIEEPKRNKEYEQGGEILAVFAVDLSDGKPEGFVKTFKVVKGHIVEQPASTCAVDLNNTNVASCTMESNKSLIEPYWPQILASGDIVSSTMAVAVKHVPHVAPPISTLALTAEGPVWLDHGLCPAIRFPNS
jgi:hypothetical protein